MLTTLTNSRRFYRTTLLPYCSSRASRPSCASLRPSSTTGASCLVSWATAWPRSTPRSSCSVRSAWARSTTAPPSTMQALTTAPPPHRARSRMTGGLRSTAACSPRLTPPPPPPPPPRGLRRTCRSRARSAGPVSASSRGGTTAEPVAPSAATHAAASGRGCKVGPSPAVCATRAPRRSCPRRRPHSHARTAAAARRPHRREGGGMLDSMGRGTRASERTPAPNHLKPSQPREIRADPALRARAHIPPQLKSTLHHTSQISGHRGVGHGGGGGARPQ